MLGIRAGGVGACAGCDRLDTLSLTVTKHPFGVERERLAPAFAAKQRSDAVEVLRQPPLRGSIHQICHDPFDHDHSVGAIAYRNYFTNDRKVSGFWDRKDDAVVLGLHAN